MEFRRFVEPGKNSIHTIETEKWTEHPEKNWLLQSAGMRTFGEVFTDLEDHLEEMGMLPDEYFLPSYRYGNQYKDSLPEFSRAICSVNFGGSEGIYMDISLAVHENDGIKLVPFATGKTLSDDVEAFYKMSMICAECSLMLNGRGDPVRLGERNFNIGFECVEREPELSEVIENAKEHALQANADEYESVKNQDALEF